MTPPSFTHVVPHLCTDMLSFWSQLMGEASDPGCRNKITLPENLTVLSAPCSFFPGGCIFNVQTWVLFGTTFSASCKWRTIGNQSAMGNREIIATKIGRRTREQEMGNPADVHIPATVLPLDLGFHLLHTYLFKQTLVSFCSSKSESYGIHPSDHNICS